MDKKTGRMMDEMDTEVLSGVWDRLEGFLRVSPGKREASSGFFVWR